MYLIHENKTAAKRFIKKYNCSVTPRNRKIFDNIE